MKEFFLPIPTDKYGAGILLDEYNGSYSLVSARRSEDGTIYKDWCYPQRNKQPIEKSLPWKIKLGDSPQEAFDALAYFGKAMREVMSGGAKDPWS